jgi:cell division control protein 6
MIVRRDVFDETHRPQRLLHRDRETTRLLAALDPGDDGTHRGHAVLSGPPGVGKTVLAKQCCDRLRERRGTSDAHVRCLGAEPGTIYRRAIAAFPNGPASVEQNKPVEVVADDLQRLVAAADPGAVVVLDEADDIDPTAVDVLTNVRGLSVVVICHSHEDLFNRISPAARERLQAGTTLEIDRYGVSELGDILERRAEVGLRAGVWTRGQLETIADAQAGVARRGIQSLRAAAEVAADAGHDRIQEADIERGYQRARSDIRAANLDSLPFKYQYCYALVRAFGPITSQALYERYFEFAETAWRDRLDTAPSTKRTVRGHLTKLREYDLIETHGGEHRPVEPSLEATYEFPCLRPTTRK